MLLEEKIISEKAYTKNVTNVEIVPQVGEQFWENAGKIVPQVEEQFKNRNILELLSEKLQRFERKQNAEAKRREEERKSIQQENENKRIEHEKAEKELKEKIEKELQEREKLEAELQAEKNKQLEEFKNRLNSDFYLEQKVLKDAEGNRWVKCEYCGKVDITDNFTVYGGPNHINLGTCNVCSQKKDKKKIIEIVTENKGSNTTKQDTMICPDCNGELRERNGRYGIFLGCSNYPKCRYTRTVNTYRR